MYAKPHVIEVSILHILIPDKKWMGNIYCEVWTLLKSLFGRSDKILGIFEFISPPPYSPFCTLKIHTFDPIPLENSSCVDSHLVVCSFVLIPATWSHLFGLCSCLFVLFWALIGLFACSLASCLYLYQIHN